jgi:hypothetical protein
MHVAHAGVSRSELRRRLAPLLVALTLLFGSWSVTGAYADEPDGMSEPGVAQADPAADAGLPDAAGEPTGQADEPATPDQPDEPATPDQPDEPVTPTSEVTEPSAPAVAPDGIDELRTVEGTVHNIVIETEEQQHGEPLPVVTAVEVDEQFYEMPAEETATLQTGDVVEVTVSSAPDLPIAEALELASAGESDEASILTVEETGEVDQGLVLDEAATAHTLTVLPVYWSAGPSVTTASLTTLASSTRDYWAAQTGGQLAISTIDVRNWTNVAAPASCDSTAMMDLHARARSANGVGSPTSTSHVLVFFPQSSSCGWAGMATVGGGTIWVNGSTAPDVLTHEFGHNLGLGHANTMTCAVSGTRVPLTIPVTNCTTVEYRDYADVMGIGMGGKPTGNLNTALADSLGYVALTDVTSPPAGGLTADLSPLGSVSGHRALRMSISNAKLYVDYRPAVGPDNRWSGWAGVQVHLKLVDSRGIPSSYLLNMQPASGDFSSPTSVRPQMPVGTTWQIPGTYHSLGVVSAGSVARVTIGSTSAVTGTQQAALERYVTRVYLDLFKRAVDPSGLQTWGTALLNGTPRVAVANSITYSTEYRTRLITASYNHFLGRSPEPKGLQDWLGYMASGGTIQQMEAGFLASPEYYAKAGGTPSGWVTRLYNHVLGRSPGASEVAHWTRTLAAGQSHYSVAMGFLLSSEYLTTVVDSYYVDLLGRRIDPSGRATWVSAIQRGTRVEAIIGGIVASDEYYNRH